MPVIQNFSMYAYNLHAELPFFHLHDAEFNSLFKCDYRCVDYNICLCNLLSNPDKSDESDPDHMLGNISSDYYTSEKVDKTLQTSGPGSLTFTTSLQYKKPFKNLNVLSDIIYSLLVKPDILAITETKLNSNTVTNVNIPGYNFYHVDSDGSRWSWYLCLQKFKSN